MVFSGDHKSSSTDSSSEHHEAVFIDHTCCSHSNLQTPAAAHHILLNRVSLRCTAVTYGGVVLLTQDGHVAVPWALAGAFLNVVLSFTLKRILNQERPVSRVCSGPGMPSTHAQSISFATIFFIHSIIGWLGFNGLSVILSVLVIAVGLYFSWLRVLLEYHTTCQVVAGLVVGSIFSFLWFCTCSEDQMAVLFKDITSMYKLC